MSNRIQLLPDSIANQIAAGEVIQRPASVVKELMENAVDAGSSFVQLIVKDAGKTLIQVVDDGSGMSEIDARMSFERHATSKISKSEDLFALHTKGFRGEALASIAAIAHVELNTRRTGDAIGTMIQIKGTALLKQEATSTPEGTSISVRHLFYNVPARRKFLKSDPVELKHILDEFQRLVLAHPEIAFSCFHNDQEIYHLPAGNLRQRIVGVFGKSINEKIIPVKEETDFVNIVGFIGKPSFSKKSRGDQFFFVNNRFIRSAYFGHGVKASYHQLIPEGDHPFYTLFVTIDPSKVDINVHPTKQEVKFEDERLLYNYIKVSVKHALGQYTLTPKLDFDSDVNYALGAKANHHSDNQLQKENYGSHTGGMPTRKQNLENWESVYAGIKEATFEQEKVVRVQSEWSFPNEVSYDIQDQRKAPFQLHNTYIVNQIKNGLIIIDQHTAHQRILYEMNLRLLKSGERVTQKALFPETISLDRKQAIVFKAILSKMNDIGFMIEEFGDKDFVIQGLPVQIPEGYNTMQLIETIIDQYTSNLDFNLDVDENIARSIAKSTAIKRGKSLEKEELQSIIDRLFACADPSTSPSGKKCFVTLPIDNIRSLFDK